MAQSGGYEVSSRSRVDRLRLCFSRLNADAVLVSHLPNIQYLCGFTGSAALLLVESGRSTLYTDSRYTFQAREEVAGCRVTIAKRGLIKALGDDLRARRGRRRVAYASAQVTVAQKASLESAAGSRIRWVSGGDAVERLRAVKDASELAIMQEAAVLISEVVTDVIPSIEPGITELELAAEVEYGIKRKGGSGPSFETIVASGPRSAWAHARPTSKPLRKNELVVMDQGAILRGYCSDLTRTVFLGRATTRVRRLYRAVLEAQEAARSAIMPGVSTGDVDAAARQVLRRYGLAKYFTHSTGHGLGLEIHEMPRLGRGEKTLLEKGMVVTVEPGVYVEGLGGIRIEDDVVVTPTGAVSLTNAPREFLEL
ncbi:MAG TPA: Xaa-Pro peptidase family protein [Candidatus Limnocylindria bacterium]|nr:Xaa-Pro peptidase family protein [Candidatus Limnocylindria bacterium]